MNTNELTILLTKQIDQILKSEKSDISIIDIQDSIKQVENKESQDLFWQ